ncbi:4Fe-4S binding protein [bacterium]|nr:4Fe-4S binding protein [bacterium]
MKKVRIFSQLLFFAIFLILFVQTESNGNDELQYPVKIFLDFDPFILVTTFFSNYRVFSKTLYLSLVTVLFTVFFGRIFCGWVCPFGTIHEAIGSQTKSRFGDFHRMKYYLLILLISSSICGIQLGGFLDPICFLIRSLTFTVNPVINSLTRETFDKAFETLPSAFSNVSEAIFAIFKKYFLSFKQPMFQQNLLIFILFFLVISLNFLERRFWCNNICPLGALLGLLSPCSLFGRKVKDECLKCGNCDKVCNGDSLPHRGNGNFRPGECLICFNCQSECPTNAIFFAWKGFRGNPIPDVKRRKILASAASGIIFSHFFKVQPERKVPSPQLIRPPGSVSEEEFLRRCIKCGECMKVCITNGLQPTFLEAGLGGMWTPTLVPKLGYCEYRCTLCGQVCPTQAIEKKSVNEKAKVKIGLAFIDKNRCLPYSQGIDCIVCEEHCPTPKKSIWFQSAEVILRSGEKRFVSQPKVDQDLCIGCGICEAKCPVVDLPAIYVTSIGETRSKVNQMRLSGY